MATRKASSSSISSDLESRIKSLEELSSTSDNSLVERIEILETRYRKLIHELKSCRLPLNWNELSL
jgi:hypothetical protein